MGDATRTTAGRPAERPAARFGERVEASSVSSQLFESAVLYAAFVTRVECNQVQVITVQCLFRQVRPRSVDSTLT